MRYVNLIVLARKAHPIVSARERINGHGYNSRRTADDLTDQMHEIEAKEEIELLNTMKRMLIEFVDEMDFREIYNFVCLNSFLVDKDELARIKSLMFEHEYDYQREEAVDHGVADSDGSASSEVSDLISAD